jgi:hypothetical protein
VSPVKYELGFYIPDDDILQCIRTAFMLTIPPLKQTAVINYRVDIAPSMMYTVLVVTCFTSQLVRLV